MGLREIYDLPNRSGLAGRMIAVMLVFAAAVTGLWLVLPAGPVAVAVTAILLLLLVGGGVFTALSSRQAREPPGHDPAPQPPTE